MKRLIEKIVFCGLVTAWRLATVPTSRSPPCVNATTDGVVRPPSAFSITVGSPPSSTAIQLLVVPRSIPIVFPIVSLLLSSHKRTQKSKRDRSRFVRDGRREAGLSGLEPLAGASAIGRLGPALLGAARGGECL